MAQNYDFYKDFMLPAYDEKVASGRPNMFFRNQFKNKIQTGTPYATIDVERDKRLVSANVIRGSGIANRNFAKRFSNKEYEIPLYDEDMPITSAQLNLRVPGIDPFQEYGRELTMAYHIANGMYDMTAKIMRAWELQAAQAFQEGKIELVNGDIIDFHKRAELGITPTIKWDVTNAPLPTIIADMELLGERIFQYGKRKPNKCVMGAKAYQLFRNNPDVLKYLDTRWAEPGRLIASEIDQNATLQGRLSIGDYFLDIYTYPEFYELDNGTQVKYMTTDKVVMWNDEARFDDIFGAVEIMPIGEQWYQENGMPVLPQVVERSLVPYLQPTAKNLVMGVQSAPLVVPHAIDCIGTLDNVDSV
jgi:hypothetical protein